MNENIINSRDQRKKFLEKIVEINKKRTDESINIIANEVQKNQDNIAINNAGIKQVEIMAMATANYTAENFTNICVFLQSLNKDKKLGTSNDINYHINEARKSNNKLITIDEDTPPTIKASNSQKKQNYVNNQLQTPTAPTKNEVYIDPKQVTKPQTLLQRLNQLD